MKIYIADTTKQAQHTLTGKKNDQDTCPAIIETSKQFDDYFINSINDQSPKSSGLQPDLNCPWKSEMMSSQQIQKLMNSQKSEREMEVQDLAGEIIAPSITRPKNKPIKKAQKTQKAKKVIKAKKTKKAYKNKKTYKTKRTNGPSIPRLGKLKQPFVLRIIRIYKKQAFCTKGIPQLIFRLISINNLSSELLKQFLVLYPKQTQKNHEIMQIQGKRNPQVKSLAIPELYSFMVYSKSRLSWKDWQEILNEELVGLNNKLGTSINFDGLESHHQEFLIWLGRQVAKIVFKGAKQAIFKIFKGQNISMYMSEQTYTKLHELGNDLNQYSQAYSFFLSKINQSQKKRNIPVEERGCIPEICL